MSGSSLRVQDEERADSDSSPNVRVEVFEEEFKLSN